MNLTFMAVGLAEEGVPKVTRWGDLMVSTLVETAAVGVMTRGLTIIFGKEIVEVEAIGLLEEVNGFDGGGGTLTEIAAGFIVAVSGAGR